VANAIKEEPEAMERACHNIINAAEYWTTSMGDPAGSAQIRLSDANYWRKVLLRKKLDAQSEMGYTSLSDFNSTWTSIPNRVL